MKLHIGDMVLVTGGKDKGKKAKVLQTYPKKDRVTVEGANMYVKHVKPMGGRSGEKVKRERPLPTANVAIINDAGKPDRIGYKIMKDGTKMRIFKKTGKEVPQPVREKKKS